MEFFATDTADAIMALAAKIVGGDLEAQAVGGALEMMTSREGGTLCLLCPRVLGQGKAVPHGIFLIRPQLEAASEAIVNGVCRHCAARLGSEEAIRRSVVNYYRENVFAGKLRVLSPLSEPGHA